MNDGYWKGFVIRLAIGLIGLLVVVGIILLGCSDCFPPKLPSVEDTARDILSQAFRRQGVVVTSGKIDLLNGTIITNKIGGDDLGLPSANVCVGSDARIDGLLSREGVLTYTESDSVVVRIRSYCYWESNHLEQKVKDLNIGINSVSCPQNYPRDSNAEVGCIIGFTEAK